MRKYQETTDYWLYVHTTPNGMIYVGMSKRQPCFRWHPLQYKSCSLSPYIEQYGWENIEHRILIDGLTKAQAEQWEDRIIQALSMNGLCINERRSGGIERDDKQAYMKQYKKQWEEDNKEHCKQYKKQWEEGHKEERQAYNKKYKKQYYSTPEGKIYNRVSNYNQRHTQIETPAEAKQKYLEFGYIPNYIKNDDLC